MDTEEREERLARHRKGITDLFARRPGLLPDGGTPWDDGLVIVYVRGGPSDYGRIHRASCPSLTAYFSAYNSKSSLFVHTGTKVSVRSKAASGCKVCGTEGIHPEARYWGETEEQVEARLAAAKVREEMRRRTTERENKDRFCVSTAREDARRVLIARHADEYQAIYEDALARARALAGL